MSLSSKVGSITAKTTTGNQATTGVGFQPKIIFFFYNYRTSDASAANFSDGMGVAVSSSDRRVVFGSENNGALATSGGNVTAGHNNTHCIAYMAPGGSTTITLSADLVSMDSDGFTLNFDVVDGTARVINYLALGGSDLTNVKTGQFTQPTSTGNQSTTGIGFKPDCLMFIRVRSTTTAPNSTANSPPRNSIGFGTVLTQAITSSMYQTNGSTAFVGKTYQRTSKIMATIFDDGTLNSEASLSSLDSDGFTLNWTTVGTATYVFYIALKGARFSVGSFNQATSTGNQSITGLGFQPIALLLASGNKATSSSIQAQDKFSIGFGTGSSARGCIWHGGVDAAVTANVSEDLDRTKIIKMMTASGASPTTEAAADLSSLDNDGFTLNWSTADATAREIIYLAMGSSLNSNFFGLF